MTAIPPPPPSNYGAPIHPPSSSNGKAITSMILGIVSIVFCWYWFLSIPAGAVALILGVLGKKEIAEGRGTNGGMATSGIVTGAIGLALGAILLVLILFTGESSYCFNFNGEEYCAE